MVIEILLT